MTDHNQDLVERVARAIAASFADGSPDLAEEMRMDWQTWAPEARAAIAAAQSDGVAEALREALQRATKLLDSDNRASDRPSDFRFGLVREFKDLLAETAALSAPEPVEEQKQ